MQPNKRHHYACSVGRTNSTDFIGNCFMVSLRRQTERVRCQHQASLGQREGLNQGRICYLNVASTSKPHLMIGAPKQTAARCIISHIATRCIYCWDDRDVPSSHGCQGIMQNYLEFECNSAEFAERLQNPCRMAYIVVVEKQILNPKQIS